MPHTVKSTHHPKPNQVPFYFDENMHKKGLAIPQLEILRVILEDEKIDISAPEQKTVAQSAIHCILQENGLKTVNANFVYSQLNALSDSASSQWALKGSAVKTYPLHEAAREGNLAEVKKLINMGYQINEADYPFGSTPLHMAAMYGHHEVAAFLIQKGANINALTYAEAGWFGDSAYTALDLAIKCEPGTQTLDLLLQHGAKSASDLQSHLYDLFNAILDATELKNFKQFDLSLSKLEVIVKNDASALCLFEQNYFNDQTEVTPLAIYLKEVSLIATDRQFYDRVTTTLKVFDAADTDHIAEYYILAKKLTHAFPSGEMYHFQVGEAQGYIAAEGLFASITAPLAANSLKNFSTYIQNTYDYNGFNAIQKKYRYFSSMDQYETIKNNVFKHVAHSYEIAADSLMTCGQRQTSEKLFELYCAGETLVLPTGWDGHAIDILLNKNLNLFMVANAGQQFYTLHSGLNAYNLKYAITAEDIYHILINTDRFDLEFKRFYDLGLTVNEKYTFETDPQMYGNCAWYSQRISEKALIYLELTKTTGFDKLSLDLADIWFNQLDDFQKTSILKDYLAHPALEVSALGDILVNYHHSLKTVDEKERAKLILDNLTSPENKAEFDHYCAEHRAEMSPQLKNFIKDYEMHMLTDDLYHVKLQETAGTQALKINDVIKMDEADDLLASLDPTRNHQSDSHTTPVVAPLPDCPEVYTPCSLPLTSILQEQHQVVIAVLA